MIVDIPNNSDFSIHNIPFGIFSTPNDNPRVGVAIGNDVLDMAALAKCHVFDFDISVLSQDTLNEFIALGKPVTSKVRTNIQDWLQDEQSILAEKRELFIPQAQVTMHMPVRVGDYTDFYSSLEHATNVGRMFRGPDNALTPNWKHMPIAYHGRSSSIILSGEPVKRPKGQVLSQGMNTPTFMPSKRLDIELEMAFITNSETKTGTSISVHDAENHIFGMVLFNDWSARDIQKWEYVPLGPFLAKNFASSISPWIVTIEAIEPFRVPGPTQQPKVLPYLQHKGHKNFDIDLEVSLAPQGEKNTIICQSNYKYMYWNMAQQLAHHTVNGCNIHVGDMMASGTISGKNEKSYGSMLELSMGGTKPIVLNNGNTRTFLEDYDTITMRGYAEKENIRVGFGEMKTQILPAD